MLPINYPKNRDEFEKNYISALDIDNNLRAEFNTFKNSNAKFRRILKNITLDDVLISDLDKLLAFSRCLMSHTLTDNEKDFLAKLFNYDKDIKFTKSYQPKIKYFFENNLEIKTCYFCNLDFVNAFKDIGDYHNAVDFLKRAPQKELCKIKDIGAKTADEIVLRRVEFLSLRKIKNIKKIISNIKYLTLNNKHSQFTLDHVLDKASHPLLALSLYNFVPSCYSCNSKFKGSKQFFDENTANYLSPTAKDFAFNKDVKFELFFHNGKDVDSAISKNDFVLDFNYAKNKIEYEKYINTFKLKGRYIFHKNEIVNLVEKKKRYSSSKIEEMAKNLGIPADKVKEDLFGKELFHGKLEDKSMTKFKRDIAEQIGILK